jgi:hypothetical protein
MNYIPLELPPRPPMQHALYLASVQQAADVLRAAQPWLLIQYPGQTDWLVAAHRTGWTRLSTAVVNIWRRPMRWWLWRLRMAREARSYDRRTRGLQ